MNTTESHRVNEPSTIDINVDQLLQLRHIEAPATRRIPDSNAAWLGTFTSKQRGHGTDYDDLRQYSPGDDIRHIDWRASARTNALHTRLYRAEKEHRTSIICDMRLCMFTGSNILRANRAVRLCARLLWQACKAGTRVTLIIITPEGLSMLAPGTGHTTAIRGCKLLATEHQRLVQTLIKRKHAPTTALREINNDYCRHESLAVSNEAHGPTLDAALKRLIAHSEHKTTQLWASGFDYPGELFFNTLGSIAQQGHNVALQIDDPVLSNSLPSGDFHYQANHAQEPDTEPESNHRQAHQKRILHSARINKSNQEVLSQNLKQVRQCRVTRFAELSVPYLSNAAGDDAIIAALRHQGVLA